MSGIFGFTMNTDKKELLQEALDGLEYWNRIYGDHARDCALVGRSGLGCHVEHFSDRFPGGARSCIWMVRMRWWMPCFITGTRSKRLWSSRRDAAFLTKSFC